MPGNLIFCDQSAELPAKNFPQNQIVSPEKQITQESQTGLFIQWLPRHGNPVYWYF